jgi:hypothetical protein
MTDSVKDETLAARRDCRGAWSFIAASTRRSLRDRELADPERRSQEAGGPDGLDHHAFDTGRNRDALHGAR